MSSLTPFQREDPAFSDVGLFPSPLWRACVRLSIFSCPSSASFFRTTFAGQSKKSRPSAQRLSKVTAASYPDLVTYADNTEPMSD